MPRPTKRPSKQPPVPTTPPPVVPPEPEPTPPVVAGAVPVPPPTFPVEFDHAAIIAAWGAEGGLRRHLPDGTVVVMTFSEKGPISRAWLARAGTERCFPAALDWFQSSGRTFVTFQGAGRGKWILSTATPAKAESWQWVDSSGAIPE